MKKIFFIVCIVAMSLVSCSKYDDVALWNKSMNMESRISNLEELCIQLNIEINTMQTIITAIEDNDYITSVVPVMQNGVEVGYTITFAKNAPITIYHGKDGENNAEGGYIPQIGVRQDSDGVYYWTLDGEWLTDDAGNKIQAEGRDGKDGTDGKDGVDGKDGADGKDGNGNGNMPQLKIENNNWYVSYDEGDTWTLLGEYTGENGKDGKDGDSFFQNVDTSNPDYVIFVLADGTEIKIPTWYSFEQLVTLCNQMNKNIEALQTIVNALQDNDYITNVTPLIENGEQIGYTITFSKSGSIVIYHGKNGTEGKDGLSPIIGAKYDNDGNLYWTIDGEWMLDDNGDKVPVGCLCNPNNPGGSDSNGDDKGNNGDDGNGQGGKDGKDGITPQLKIENGYWFVSYDNGKSWQQLGKATGENGKDGSDGATGAAGKDGKDGDSFFSDVDTSNPEYIVFTLSDGTQIKLPTWYAFEQLQLLCNQMNTNINALQTIIDALKDNDYITGVTPLMENGKEVGYTITFSKSKPITIYHGKDGKDSSNGYTPQIGVKQDTDGIYYWTLNGEWLTDESGNKIKAEGRDGAKGEDGQKGDKGADGLTPQLKIEGGYWYISYDNGSSWTNLGKATGENGTNGAAGKDGDSFFKSVNTTNSDYVVFILADGTEIKLPRYSSLSISFDKEGVVSMAVKSTADIAYTIISSQQDIEIDVVTSADIKAKITKNSTLTGTINITTSDTIDEYSHILVFVSNGEKTIMKKIVITEDTNGSGSDERDDEEDLYIPDPIFRAYCIKNFDSNNNGKLSRAEALQAESIYVPNLGINTLEGIQYFTNITSLRCDDNNLTELNVSLNTKLENLICYDNPLELLNLGNINIPNTSNLNFINGNLRTSTKLKIIGSQITELMITNNKIQSLDVSECPALKKLYCYDNQLKELDLSKTDMNGGTLWCSNNPLETLYLKNGWDIFGITRSRSTMYIPDTTQIKYVD